MDLSTVTAVIINYRTPDLTLRALSTFKSVYPTVKTLLIDNGSGVECGGMLVTVVFLAVLVIRPRGLFPRAVD